MNDLSKFDEALAKAKAEWEAEGSTGDRDKYFFSAGGVYGMSVAQEIYNETHKEKDSDNE